MPRLLEVEPRPHHRLRLRYDDGAEGEVDLSSFAGKGVFQVWNEPGGFEAARIGASGQVVWGDDIDMCPDALYLRLTGKSPDDRFPRLREMNVHA